MHLSKKWQLLVVGFLLHIHLKYAKRSHQIQTPLLFIDHSRNLRTPQVILKVVYRASFTSYSALRSATRIAHQILDPAWNAHSLVGSLTTRMAFFHALSVTFSMTIHLNQLFMHNEIMTGEQFPRTIFRGHTTAILLTNIVHGPMTWIMIAIS